MSPSSPSPSWRPVFAGLYLAVQILVPIAGMHPHRRPVFSARFAWSMFAGPLTARCAHRVDYATRDGTALPLPLPPTDHPAYAILAARTPGEFSRASGLIVAYAESDADVALALDDLLRRYRSVIDPRHTHSLVSTLDCASPGTLPLHRVLRLDPSP